MIHIYAHVFRIINNLTFGFVLLNSVTRVYHPKEIMIAAIKSKIKYPTSNAPFGSAYEEHTAIKDTAAEVRVLRKRRLIQKEIRELYSLLLVVFQLQNNHFTTT